MSPRKFRETSVVRNNLNKEPSPMTTLISLKVKKDHRSEFSNLSNWKKKPEKKSGLQRDSNP